jgi:dephospho-CoA kinase
MKHFAVTGNIGSGKSTVCSIFELLEIPVYYSDYRAKLLMNTDKELKKELMKLLGNKIYSKDGELDKKKMASKIFTDKKLLEKVNSIVHPAVRKDYMKWRAKQKAPYTLQESALTFEIGADKHVDDVILVYAPEKLLIERTMQRNNISKTQVKDRLSKQMSQDIKKEKARYIIDNSLGVSLIEQVIKLHKKFSKK